jgi:four helix bundle protein
VGNFEDLDVWQRAHRLTLRVYAETRSFPGDERFGITSQLRRSAASIPANLAEGSGRGSDRELARFCRIALGSTSELEYHLILARDLGYLPRDVAAEISDEIVQIRRMLLSLTKHLTSSRSARSDSRLATRDSRP